MAWSRLKVRRHAGTERRRPHSMITICYDKLLIATRGTVSRIGVIGPVAPDYFAENVGDALQRLGHVVTQLGAAQSPRP